MCYWYLLQIGVFGKVDDFQRQLDRVARVLDTDYDDALAEMVRGERKKGQGCADNLATGEAAAVMIPLAPAWFHKARFVLFKNVACDHNIKHLVTLQD